MEAHVVGGEFMHGRESPEPMFSNTDTFFTVEQKGDRYKVNKMTTSMKVNAQFFESEGVAHNVYFRRSLTLLEEKVKEVLTMLRSLNSMVNKRSMSSSTEAQYNL